MIYQLENRIKFSLIFEEKNLLGNKMNEKVEKT